MLHSRSEQYERLSMLSLSLSKKTTGFYIASLFLGIGYLQSESDWQLWHSQITKGKIAKKATAELENHLRFRDTMSDFFYYHGQARLMAKTFNKNFFGIELRAAFEKNSAEKWRYESRPGLLLTNSFKLGRIHLDSRFRFYYRFLEGRENRGAMRIRLGISPYKSTYFSPFLKGEIFYNHNNFQEYDRNRISIGFSSKIAKNASATLYYLHQENKREKKGPWNDTHVFGIDIKAKI